MRKNIAALALVGGTCALALALNTWSPFNMHDDKDSQPEQQNNEQQPLLVQHSSPLMPALTVDELFDRSDLVVVATVGNTTDTLLIDPVDDKEPKFFTDTLFTIETVVYGTPDYVTGSTSNVTIRTEGGTGNYVQTVNDGTPDFLEGDSYLLFLYQLDDGTYYNTAGNHYYIVGISTGAWKESASEPNVFDSPCWQPEDAQTATLDGVETIAASLPSTIESAQTPNKNSGVNADLENIEMEFEQGIISEEEYQRLLELAQQEASSFARVMSESEQSTYEQEMLEQYGAEQSDSQS